MNVPHTEAAGLPTMMIIDLEPEASSARKEKTDTRQEQEESVQRKEGIEKQISSMTLPVMAEAMLLMYSKGRIEDSTSKAAFSTAYNYLTRIIPKSEKTREQDLRLSLVRRAVKYIRRQYREMLPIVLGEHVIVPDIYRIVEKPIVRAILGKDDELLSKVLRILEQEKYPENELRKLKIADAHIKQLLEKCIPFGDRMGLFHQGCTAEYSFRNEVLPHADGLYRDVLSRIRIPEEFATEDDAQDQKHLLKLLAI